MNETWTPREEDIFTEMEARRERVMLARKTPVIAIAAQLTDLTLDEIADYLIEHADSIRDALNPYDSGVRAA